MDLYYIYSESFPA